MRPATARAFAASAFLIAASTAEANFDAGLAAYESGDFETARAEWEESAVAGDAEAQFHLGKMLANGVGVRKDYITAYAWLRLAGEAGIPDADKYVRVLEQKYLPRYCQYEAQALVRDYRNGRPERLVSEVDRNQSRCWGHSPPK